MGWLFGQTWIWCLIAFVLGAVVAWLIAVLIYPRESDAFRDISPDDDDGGRVA
ncbi:LapA family protein [Leekyejoonella antrihumi]|uniref:LapA family protein n=1 Tax=Leekyejoonella antrihumi TaxID=1660198 RepID=A0A563E6Q6_9MICO|nr:LapA family protein [Leekyejoonella antrihumi]TWP37892.1 LapA family protein [Leekyejoonella antrihumi]